MKLDLNWIIQEPIDFEHKTYVLMDYFTKVEEDFNNNILYPSFQELSLHLANINSILEKQNLISLNRDNIDIDDEILLMDLTYTPLIIDSVEDKLELFKTATSSKQKFQDLFIIGKSLWSILHDSVLVKIKENPEVVFLRMACGVFYFKHKNIRYVYQYNIEKINNKSSDFKCKVNLLTTDNDLSILEIIENKFIFEDNNIKSFDMINNLPIFEVKVNDDFPIEGSLLTMIKRKIMNYTFQTIKIEEIKENGI
jgi:hypothetical protein